MSKLPSPPSYPPTRMDILNARNRKKQKKQRRKDARKAKFDQRPAWELMSLHTDLPYEDDKGDKQTLPVGSLALRINTVPLLKAIFWPHQHSYVIKRGTTFFEGTTAGRFDRNIGFSGIDAYLETAPDAEAALPHKCFVCGSTAENRGLFCAEEPVFFCTEHYDPAFPLLLPGGGYQESHRPDRT